ncbi:PapD-like protein [Sporodiniella umbellata]|nr:PapD-like protein [Sporodiniella umbellata]
MAATIEPSSELVFHGPFAHASRESIMVKNPNDYPIVFKVKTTAPKQYCVRPNAGKVEPNSEIEVQIVLQPFKEKLPDDYKCKDKFLLQTALLDTSVDQDITNMWLHIEKNGKENIHQHKIKCIFAGLKKQTRLNDGTGRTNTVIVSEPSANHQVSITDPILEDMAPTPELSPSSVESIPTPISRRPFGASHNLLPPVHRSNGHEREQLAQALEKIKRLEIEFNQLMISRDQLIAQNLQNTQPSHTKSFDAAHHNLELVNSTEGYSPRVVMGISFLVFLFTYVFF